MRSDVAAVLIVVACGALSAVASAAGGCATNADCKAGRVCLSGNCTEPTKACGKDTDCPGEQVCNDHACGGVTKVPPPAEPPAKEAAPRHRETNGCRGACQAARTECEETAMAKEADCTQVAKDPAHARVCASQARDEKGSCGDEFDTCASNCR